MPYSEEVADRVRHALAELDVIASERKMFGGIAFMVRGHMTVGVIGSDLIARVGKEAHDEALDLPDARAMDFTGRPMKGFLYVGPDGYREDDALLAWIGRSLDFTSTLPDK